ncbi:MAG: PKD domain-containing protein [Candidatus Anammoxibacter sp.]
MILEGQSGGGAFGVSVASAGDFNGDGLDDVIVGAPNDDNNAFIFFGGITGTKRADADADVILDGQSTGGSFGSSVASAGDFNGDGIDDVIVGASRDDNNGERDSGSAFIFFSNAVTSEPTPKSTPSFAADPTIGFAPLTVQFNDTSTGDITNWNWNFGDGLISLLQNPTHEYEIPGLYDVKLTVIGEGGISIGVKEEKAFIEVLEGEGLTAAFFGEPLEGNAPFTVNFFDQSSGEKDNWDWDFGDGATSSEQNPVHTYNTTGEFAVQLTVSGNNKTSTEAKDGLVIVGEGNEPTVGFVAEVISVSTAKSAAKLNTGSGKVTADAEEADEASEFTVKFRDLSSTPGDEIISREWDFGDGAKSSEKNPVHTYTGTDADTFDVTLTVENTRSTDTGTKPAFVSRTAEIVPGLVKGEVTDSTSGIGIDDASISLKKAGRTLAGFTTTDEGLYFLEAPSGNYTISAIKEKFSEFTKSVSVSSTKVETINIVLELIESGDDDDVGGKSFTFNCEHSMKRGHVFELEKLTLNVGDTENCTLKLTNHEPGKTVKIATLLKKGFRSAIEIAPERGVTDENGELKITITAIRKGKDWAAWAVKNDRGQFKFNMKTYDGGLAWGMFVAVK